MLSFKKNIYVINFLNQKAISLLLKLNEETPIKSVDLRDKIVENTIMSISSYYRYMNFLLENNLISKEKNRKKEGGYIYWINNIGKCFLKTISKSNLPFYSKLNHNLNFDPNIESI